MKMKSIKAISAFLAILMLLSVAPFSGFVYAAGLAASGTCGKNLTWTLNSDGLLTVSGQGAMSEWISNDTLVPWNSIKKTIKTAVIENGVTRIDDFAFDGCSGLTSVSIPDSVTDIYLSAFDSCTALTSVTIPDSVTDIGNFAFYGCTALTSIVIPESVTSIGMGAFNNCTMLSSITIPDSMTHIGWNAFDCTAWYNTQPDGLVYIGKIAYAYKGDKPANTPVIIADGTKGIAYRVFDSYAGLVSITLPDSIKYIDYAAFYGCTKLSDIYYSGTNAEWEKITIDSSNEVLSNAKIHYNSIMRFGADKTVAVAPGSSAEEILKQADNAVLLGTDGKPLADGKLPGSGMILKFADGTQYALVIYGDADSDGTVSSADARLTLRRAVGLEMPLSWRDNACNVDKNEAITSADARLVLRAAVGLEDMNGWF